ncbi:hypothetical protein KP509_21G089300 [Ceratopteris richardii]|uniref:SAM domain-containing protein n=1 Tax=Ceratopteris richardii TaxID=49495 RepID=A0A8T2SFA5_CERRI|nr:hypothetical protein KP509_21G089300 [Ceratopteris richardii]
MCSTEKQGYHRNGNHPAEASCSFQISGHQAGDIAGTSCLRHHDYNAERHCKPWVEVRKQRVVIVIPPIPETRRKSSIEKQPSRKGVPNHYASTQIIGVIHERRSQKAFKNKVYNKRKKVRMCINGSGGWETEKDALPVSGIEKDAPPVISWNAREKTRKDAPALSGIDLLLSSALRLGDISSSDVKNDCNGSQDSCGDKASSLDAADSSHEPSHSYRGWDRGVSRIHSAMKHRDKSDHSLEGWNHMAQDPDNQLNDGPIGTGRTGRRSIPGDKRAGLFNASECIRIINLEKHLKNAGGLKRWLYSLGLEQFMDVFDKGRWGATDLLELRMDDLKRMGKAAVGPRRKLIWAIHHFSQQIV